MTVSSVGLSSVKGTISIRPQPGGSNPVTGTGILNIDLPAQSGVTSRAGQVITNPVLTVNAEGIVTSVASGPALPGVTSVGLVVNENIFNAGPEPVTGAGNLSLDMVTITGLKPGVYPYATITVDQYGRVTAAQSGVGGESVTVLTHMLIQNTDGSVKIDGGEVKDDGGVVTVSLPAQPDLTPGTYDGFTVNAAGLVTEYTAPPPPPVPPVETISSHDGSLVVTPSGSNTDLVLQVQTNLEPGTYDGFTVNGQGIVTGYVAPPAPPAQTISSKNNSLVVTPSGTNTDLALAVQTNLSPGTYDGFTVNQSGIVTGYVAPPGTTISSHNGSLVVTSSGTNTDLALSVQTNLTPGTYDGFTVNQSGIVTGYVAPPAPSSQVITSTDGSLAVTSSGSSTDLALSAQSGVVPGTYSGLTVNSQGIVTATPGAPPWGVLYVGGFDFVAANTTTPITISGIQGSSASQNIALFQSSAGYDVLDVGSFFCDVLSDGVQLYNGIQGGNPTGLCNGIVFQQSVAGAQPGYYISYLSTINIPVTLSDWSFTYNFSMDPGTVFFWAAPAPGSFSSSNEIMLVNVVPPAAPGGQANINGRIADNGATSWTVVCFGVTPVPSSGTYKEYPIVWGCCQEASDLSSTYTFSGCSAPGSSVNDYVFATLTASSSGGVQIPLVASLTDNETILVQGIAPASNLTGISVLRISSTLQTVTVGG